MRKICLAIICMAVLFLEPIAVRADYLDEYEEPAQYRIQTDNGSNGNGGNGIAGSDAARSRNLYAAYLDVVEKCIDQYGDTELEEGPSSGMQHFTGLSFLKLVDFNDDGTEELFLAFHVRTNDPSDNYEQHVYIFNIWGYDGKQAVLLQDGNYLYGFNGGAQKVFFVKNRQGTFFLHGAADSFERNYYYGYTGGKFGLAKSILSEEEYDEESNKWEIVYTIDGEDVSQDRYDSELAAWGSTSSAEEQYVLTPYNDNDREIVQDLIDSTIQFLREHSDQPADVQEEEEPAPDSPFSIGTGTRFHLNME